MNIKSLSVINLVVLITKLLLLTISINLKTIYNEQFSGCDQPTLNKSFFFVQTENFNELLSTVENYIMEIKMKNAGKFPHFE